jgi:choline dehydrogenase-like flavoprotein
VEAKNDLAITVLAELQRRGMEIRSETAVTRLHVDGTRVSGVECRDRKTGEAYSVTADTVVLAAGALGTPHLLLSSGLEELCPAGDAVGRYLTRHCSGIVFGAHSWIPRHEGRFHKQIGINDFYLGDPDGKGPKGKLGNIQQTQTPNIGTVVGETGPALGALLKPLVRRATGLLVMAEDRPKHDNRVYLAGGSLAIEHHYDDRDLAARKRLYARARQIHRAAGAPASYVHTINTFSHAMGTVRMGPDPEGSPLDATGRFRGADNLYVTDGSALPTPGGLNPSLTIAANALRIGSLLAQRVRTGAEAVAAR